MFFIIFFSKFDACKLISDSIAGKMMVYGTKHYQFVYNFVKVIHSRLLSQFQ